MKALLLSAAMLAVPAMASAVTVSAGDFNSLTQTLVQGGVVTFTFTAAEDIILSFSAAGTGKAIDLGNVSFGSYHGELTWDSVTTFGNLSSAVGTLASVTLAAGETYTVNFYDGITAAVGITLSYFAEAVPTPAPVPLPAAGLMLAGAVGTLAMARRRKA